MKIRSRLRKGAAVLPVVFAAACADRHPTAPTPQAPLEPLAKLQCTVSVARQVMACSQLSDGAAGGASYDRIVGGQDVYVRLSSSGTSYDSGTEILSTNVTVQNLLMASIGTTDGTTVAPTGIRVFFLTGPSVTSGTGTVSVFNEDGTDAFTASGQDYFQYNEILAPFEISGAKPWQFSASPNITFTFTVAVAAPMVNESGPLLDAVWDGSESTAWETAGNWSNNAVPNGSSVVTIPSDSLLAGANFPLLNGNGAALHLRVGFASTLDLNAFTLSVGGNVDATGTVSGGMLQMTGTGAYLSGTIPSLLVTGSTALQGSTKATGAVSVADGSLTVKDQALNIAIP